MADLRDGWYWVRWGGIAQKTPFLRQDGQWFVEGADCGRDDFEVIERIPTPEEIAAQKGNHMTNGTKATKAELRREINELRSIGRQMSNLCFNWSQRDRFSDAERECMRNLCIKWDAIERASRNDTGT